MRQIGSYRLADVHPCQAVHTKIPKLG